MLSVVARSREPCCSDELALRSCSASAWDERRRLQGLGSRPAVQSWPQQLEQRAYNLRLGLDPAGAQHSHPGRRGLFGRVLQEHGLADPGFSDQRQRSGDARSCPFQDRFDRRSFLVPPNEHELISEWEEAPLPVGSPVIRALMR